MSGGGEEPEFCAVYEEFEGMPYFFGGLGTLGVIRTVLTPPPPGEA